MKISATTLYRYTKKLLLPFHSSHTLRKDPESEIVCIEFDNGIKGYGESIPRTYVTGEDCSSVSHVITNGFFPILQNRSITSCDDVLGLLEELEGICKKTGIMLYNSALGAIDLALLDALGKLEKEHVITYLGPIVHDHIDYSITIPFLPFDKISKLYGQLQPFPFCSIKVLVGEDMDENRDRIKKLRDLMGNSVDIRIEVNGMLSYKKSLEVCLALQDCGISAIEQPVPKDDIRDMARFKKNVDVPVIADESMCSLEDARLLIENDACDIINIKISKCGGLVKSKTIYQYALSQRMQCQMGAHVGETALLTEAGRAFALTMPELKYIEGASYLLFKNLFADNGDFFKGSVSGHGLGVDDTVIEEILTDSNKIFP